jgi:glutaconyl-CoA/methylmalonyl-CoA decarboxylase subunit delta
MMLMTGTDWNYITGQGFAITIIGLLMVFAVLIALWLVFKYVQVLLNFLTIRKLIKQGKYFLFPDRDINISGEVNAAISTAIFLYLEELHDEEETVITIKKVSKNYSPWSSKIYSVSKGLNRKF